MSGPNGLDQRVAALRSELGAHTRSLNALRQTQVEQGHEMREGFAKVEERFVKVETEMREGFSVLAVGQAQITALLTAQLDEPGETD